MGNTHSSEQVSLEEFKDQVFSQVVFFISKYANHQLEFQPTSQCTPDYLPRLKTQDYQAIINYYQGGSGDVDYHIENYLNEHVLNSQENATRFHKILMAKLSQDPDDLIEEDMSDDDIDLASVASNVQQFIKSYEEAPSQAQVNDTKSQVPVNDTKSQVSKMLSNKSYKSNKSRVSKAPTKEVTREPTELSKEVTREPTELSKEVSREPTEPVPKSTSKLPVTESLYHESVSDSKLGFPESNYSGEFTQPYEIPETEYPMETSAMLQEFSIPLAVSETQNLAPEIQAEHLSDEELSECLVSRI